MSCGVDPGDAPAHRSGSSRIDRPSCVRKNDNCWPPMRGCPDLGAVAMRWGHEGGLVLALDIGGLMVVDDEQQEMSASGGGGETPYAKGFTYGRLVTEFERLDRHVKDFTTRAEARWKEQDQALYRSNGGGTGLFARVKQIEERIHDVDMQQLARDVRAAKRALLAAAFALFMGGGALLVQMLAREASTVQ